MARRPALAIERRRVLKVAAEPTPVKFTLELNVPLVTRGGQVLEEVRGEQHLVVEGNLAADLRRLSAGASMSVHLDIPYRGRKYPVDVDLDLAPVIRDGKTRIVVQHAPIVAEPTRVEETVLERDVSGAIVGTRREAWGRA